MIDLFIYGTPAPQGSKRYVGNGISIESCKALKPWRADIREALLSGGECGDEPMERFAGAVCAALDFTMPRPSSTPKRKEPPAMKKPDLDKLCRAAFDSIKSAGVIVDDSRIVQLFASKRLALAGHPSGLRIRIWDLAEFHAGAYRDLF